MGEIHHKLRHQPPSLARRIAGWLVVVAGLAMLVLPGPGLLALVLAIMLLGRRDPTLRRLAVLLRLTLRRLSRAEHAAVRRVGRWLRQQHAHSRTFIREQVRRHADGEPLALWVRVWIGVTLATMVTGIGIGLLVLLF